MFNIASLEDMDTLPDGIQFLNKFLPLLGEYAEFGVIGVFDLWHMGEIIPT